jgi:hypothetical protein
MVFCALAAFFCTQLCKSLWPSPLKPLAKTLLALVASGGVAYLLYAPNGRHVAAYGLAGAGLAICVHRAARATSLAGDWLIITLSRKR